MLYEFIRYLMGDSIMVKIDELIKVLEQKQNRTSKEESGLRELKELEESINKIKEKTEALSSANTTGTISSKLSRLFLEEQSYRRKERYILETLGITVQHRRPRPTYIPPTKEELEKQRKQIEEQRKQLEEQRQREMREQEFAEWKKKKESGELEFEEYRMRKQFMQIVVQQQEEILQAIRSGMASTQSAIKDNAEQTARAEEWYRTRRENYRIQDEMMREFLRK